MFILKGFITIAALANNSPDVLSPLGELSNISESYSREKGYYTKTGANNVRLVTFTSRRETTKIVTPAIFHQHVLDIAQWIFNGSVASNFTDDGEAFRRAFLTVYESKVVDLEVGRMVVAKGNWMPSFISWKFDDSNAEDNRIKIWFSDEAFRSQYDEYELVVIPPLTPVDTFQKVKSVVAEALSKFTMPKHVDDVYELTDGVPYTILVTEDYAWYDRENPDDTLSTTWSVAVYGIAGNNPIVIKDALADYILANSNYTREEWKPVFPDIFTLTEFTIVPYWHRHSVSDETVMGSLYSPIVSYDSLVSTAKAYIKSVTEAHLLQNLEISTVHFKSLAFICCGGMENRYDIFKLSEKIPDYALIPTTSVEFNRMHADTIGWISKFVRAVIAAEEMDEYSYIDVSFSRIERDGFMYVGFDHNNTLYLVLTRKSMVG